ncbi:SGNH/GDSL hydrolase family protein [Plantibacter sp. M259]|uniref:SGNH/GDSL hydrolase family protein n=1 Tax=Plantibacter sp. M259 TaxID=2583822 RepID=UPI001110E8E7|nr:SGNH/GDSL hydrolase family protein [Plantibacter sp. M259]
MTTGAVVLGTGTVSTAAEPVTPDLPYNVVQLGDSYSAGNGAGRYWGDPEARLSHNNYAEVYTDWLNTQPQINARYSSYAHSGAETSDMLDKQIPRVDSEADLVMFTIGGNDVGFQDIIKYCFALGYRSAGDCRAKVDSARAAIPAVEEQLTVILQRLSERMKPNAEIMLVGYPQLSTAAPHNLCDYVVLCWGGYSYDASKGVRQLGSAAADMQQRVVDAWNRTNPSNPVIYASGVARAFEGHEPEPDTMLRNNYQWINGLLAKETRVVHPSGRTDYSASTDKMNWYHPGIVGHAQVASVIQTQIGLTPRARAIQASNAGAPALRAPSGIARSVATQLASLGSAPSAVAEDGSPSAWLLGPHVQAMGTTIRLDARGSVAGDDVIASYEWDIDGDDIVDRTTAEPVAEFRFDSLYEGAVSVRATQANGKSSTASTQVLISEDGDSTPKVSDNCPDVENYSQSNEDGDAFGDECDPTPGHPTEDLPGVYAVTAAGVTTRSGTDTAPTTFEPSSSKGASLSVTKTSARPGDTVQFELSGFTAGDEAQLVWGTDGTNVIGRVVIGPDGSQSGSIVIPASAPARAHALVAVAPATFAAIELTVLEPTSSASGTPSGGSGPGVAAAPKPAPRGADGLAATGFDGALSTTLVPGSAIAIVLGALFVLMVRSKRRADRK